MNDCVLTDEVAAFIAQKWEDPEARMMFFAGSVSVKVSGLFQLGKGSDVPAEARVVSTLMLSGLLSGDEAEYARLDAIAMEVYRKWAAGRNRELN